MARITSDNIRKIDKIHSHLHDKVQSTYSVMEISGSVYVQIDTYGKSTRNMPGKISQSFQVDKDTANFLINLLKREFDI